MELDLENVGQSQGLDGLYTQQLQCDREYKEKDSKHVKTRGNGEARRITCVSLSLDV